MGSAILQHIVIIAFPVQTTGIHGYLKRCSYEVGTCVWMCGCVLVVVARGQAQGSLLSSDHFVFLRQESLAETQTLRISVGWLPLSLDDPPVFFPQCWHYKCLPPHTAFSWVLSRLGCSWSHVPGLAIVPVLPILPHSAHHTKKCQ